MAQRTIVVGASANSGGGDPLRDAFIKVNDNFTEVYARVTALEDGSIVTDIKGNVFADDSTLLVDAINGIIPTSVLSGNITNNIITSSLRTSESNITLGEGAAEGIQSTRDMSVAIGRYAGYNDQGYQSIAIGGHGAAGDLAQTSQGSGAVAIGYGAGMLNQGTLAIAIGYKAGRLAQAGGSIALNATGGDLNPTTSGFYVNPVRNETSTGNILQYNTSTNEIIYSNDLGDLTGNLTGSVFADDSTLLVDGVNGLIVGEVDTTYVTTQNGLSFGSTNGYTAFVDEAGDLFFRGTNGDGDIIIRTNASGGGQFDFTFGKDGNFTLDGNIPGYVKIADLKTLVAAAGTYADFQTAIAAL